MRSGAFARIEKPVVQPAFLALPEFDGVRGYAVADPIEAGPSPAEIVHLGELLLRSAREEITGLIRTQATSGLSRGRA